MRQLIKNIIICYLIIVDPIRRYTSPFPKYEKWYKENLCARDYHDFRYETRISPIKEYRTRTCKHCGELQVFLFRERWQWVDASKSWRYVWEQDDFVKARPVKVKS